MKDLVFFILFFFLVALFQVSSFFFSKNGLFPIDFLLPLIFLTFLRKGSLKKLFIVSSIGGFFEDLYTLRPLGVSILVFLLLFFLWKKLERFTEKSNIIWPLLLFLLFYFLYFSFLIPVSFLLSFHLYFPDNFLDLKFILCEFLVFSIFYLILLKAKNLKIRVT